MEEKIREEFAAWYLEDVTQWYGEGVRDQAEKNLDWKREDGSFADPMLRLACLAWQASRELLVIDLDAAAKSLAEAMDYPWEHMPEQGRAQMKANACKVIEAAGLKVKP